MKSKRINLNKNKININKHENKTIKYPQICAYAIEYYDLILNGKMGHYSWLEISGEDIKISAIDYNLNEDDVLDIIIFYHDIRDYEQLFYFVSDAQLKKRLAEFYEDADKCFESGAWLPFVLMCGGIFEGLLIDQDCKSGGFCEQIKKAERKNIITPHQASIMHNVRESRNIVHADNCTEDYIYRKDAMDIRIVLDKLIDKFFIECLTSNPRL